MKYNSYANDSDEPKNFPLPQLLAQKTNYHFLSLYKEWIVFFLNIVFSLNKYASKKLWII